MTYEEALKHIKPRLKLYIQCTDDNIALHKAIEALEKQIPKKPYIDNENGVYEKEYCPTCHRSLFPNDHHCRCGQVLDWSDEK